MNRYWVRWESGNYADEGCKKPPFQTWTTNERERGDDSDKTDLTMCAVIDAPSDKKIWDAIKKYFPDYKSLSCDRVSNDFTPSNRFQGFENRTKLE